MRLSLEGTNAPEEPGWVQLFNGKDLTGWKTHPDQPGAWSVNGQGELVGSGAVSHLFTERGDYTDLLSRTRAKINMGGPNVVRLSRVWPAIDTHLRVTRQVDRFTQIALRAVEAAKPQRTDRARDPLRRDSPGSRESEVSET